MKIGVTTATVFSASGAFECRRSAPRITCSTRPSDESPRRPSSPCPGMGAAREAAAGPRLAPACMGRTTCGQRPQARDGRQRAADPRPHDRDVPRRPRLLAAPVPHEGAGIAARFADPSVGGRAGARRHSGALLQPQQGLLAAGLDAGHRAVLQPRPHAARLRRAHVPPADHAGGVRPHPAGRLHRARRQGRLEGDRQRLGGQRPALPAAIRR